MSKLPKRHFWEWFKRNNKEYLELNKKSQKEASYWLSELTAHVRIYLRYFGFTLALPDKEPARLTITVNGKAEYFKKVDAFVATAPEIPGWIINALDEPVPIDFLLEEYIQKAGIHPGEFCFSFASDHREHQDLIVYHPLYTKDNERIFLELAYEAIYNLLGERSFGMDLGHVHIDNLSCANTDEIHQLEELPYHISNRGSSLIVGKDGTLLNLH